MTKRYCCICGKELDKNETNNSYPIKEDGVCCNRCYIEIVEPFLLKECSEEKK